MNDGVAHADPELHSALLYAPGGGGAQVGTGPWSQAEARLKLPQLPLRPEFCPRRPPWVFVRRSNTASKTFGCWASALE